MSLGIPGSSFTINRNSPQANGLVGWWPTIGLSDGSTLHDRIGTLNGSLTGDTFWQVDSEKGIVLDFDGTGDHVIYGTNTLTTDQPFSVVIFYRSRATGWRAVVNKASTAGVPPGDGWFLTHTNTQQLQFVFYNADRSSSAVTVGSALHNGNWFLIAGIYDGSDIWAYVNLLKSSNTAVVGHSPATTMPLQIGKYGTSSSSFHLNGQATDLRIYNRALTQDDIEHIFYYPFDLYGVTRFVTAVPQVDEIVSARSTDRRRLAPRLDMER